MRLLSKQIPMIFAPFYYINRNLRNLGLDLVYTSDTSFAFSNDMPGLKYLMLGKDPAVLIIRFLCKPNNF